MPQTQHAVSSVAANLGTGAVTSTVILDGTIAAGDIAADAVTTAKILDANVTTAKLADGAVTSAKHDEKTIKYAEVSIAAAALATLRAAPVELVAAPGAGKVLEFISAAFFLDYTAPGFTETADNIAVKYENGSGVAASETIEMTGFIDQTADTVTFGIAKNDQIVAKTGCENKALVLHNTGDGEWGNSGGSALRVKVAYRVHTTGF